jgi:hypothetical protein
LPLITNKTHQQGAWWQGVKVRLAGSHVCQQHQSSGTAQVRCTPDDFNHHHCTIQNEQQQQQQQQTKTPLNASRVR